ncbi:zinc ribbon domain-containing protein, partial [uncultured Lutibacter sp.]|uniref:zinc ribbon domain-containing protein n=1 Tax=uncultured Lutibacter sp. TaxID=437739 RepID=UPI00263497CB
MKSINCPNCGNKLNEGALFCGSCGEKIIQQTKVIKVDVNTCQKCNTPFEKDEKFCAECGTAINE